MDTQRHVIKRQIVEITLPNKENAWQLQQTLSRIFQQCLPPLLDRCLSEAGSPDYLYRIDRLELDLGELDSASLEAGILERIELTLRQALNEQMEYTQSLPTTLQKSDSMLTHLELLEHFVREGYLPWWADSNQRQLPEKSFAVLLNSDANALKRLLPGLIQESRCLQRLISYFDDNHLVAMMVLLTAATESSVASLVQTLSAVQAPLHQRSRIPVAHLRAALWRSLLQVTIAADPVISRHTEFLTAVTVRWAKLQGLPHKVLVDCLQPLLSSQIVINNEWLQAIRLPAAVERAPITLADESSGNGYARLDKLRSTRLNSKDETTSVVNETKDAVSNAAAYRHRLALTANSNRNAIFNKLRSTQSKAANEPSTVNPITDTESDLMDYRRGPAPAVISSRYAILNKLHLTQPKAANESSTVSQITDTVSSPGAYRHRRSSATGSNRNAIANKLRFTQPKPANASLSAGQTTDTVSNSMSNRCRFASASISNRYAILKGSYSAHQQKSSDEPLAEGVAIKSARRFTDSSPLNRPSAKNNSSENPAHNEAPSVRSTFSDAEALYINNAGLCMLWPFLVAFFERLELVQNGRFHNRAAKQCAASLLHYLTTEELNPPEYMLPFNKLLCAMDIDEVFDLATPLTAVQIEACDELLGAVIDNAPILNTMSVNGFRGSFLLRRGSLSASASSWLLRVEQETYDLVLERFPWSWQWFKLPWMEYPIRVEW